jgi:hypothetical protein
MVGRGKWPPPSYSFPALGEGDMDQMEKNPDTQHLPAFNGLQYGNQDPEHLGGKEVHSHPPQTASQLL